MMQNSSFPRQWRVSDLSHHLTRGIRDIRDIRDIWYLWWCVPWTPETENPRRGTYCALPAIFCLPGENNKDNPVHLAHPSTEEHQHCSSTAVHVADHGWELLRLQQSCSQDTVWRTGLVCVQLCWCWGNQKRCWVQAKASNKPGCFTFSFTVPCYHARGDIFRPTYILLCWMCLG